MAASAATASGESQRQPTVPWPPPGIDSATRVTGAGKRQKTSGDDQGQGDELKDALDKLMKQHVEDRKAWASMRERSE